MRGVPERNVLGRGLLTRASPLGFRAGYSTHHTVLLDVTALYITSTPAAVL